VLKTLLLGYPGDLSRSNILDLASFYGISDQVEVHEWLKPPAVNAHLNRARVNLLWSRKEGCNKAILEGMLSGIPALVREGFNYGFRYPYINEATGEYASEVELPMALLSMVQRAGQFSPREWVMRHMTPELAIESLANAIRPVALSCGEVWSTKPVPKTKSVNRMDYLNPEDAAGFASDYESLRRCVHPGQGTGVESAPLPISSVFA
jgi:hypothetical protein